MANGKVKWFNSRKGFGFIAQQSGPDLFVHYSAIKEGGFKNLAEGDVVEYEVVKGPKGEIATDVRIISRVTEPENDQQTSNDSYQKAQPRSSQKADNKPFNRSIEEQLKALRKHSKENQLDLANRLKRR